MGSKLDESMENALCSVIELGETKLKEKEKEVEELKGHLTKLYKVLLTLSPLDQKEEKEISTTSKAKVRRSRLGKGERWRQVREFLSVHTGKHSIQEMAKVIGTTRSTISSVLFRHRHALRVDTSTRPYRYTLR